MILKRLLSWSPIRWLLKVVFLVLCGILAIYGGIRWTVIQESTRFIYTLNDLPTQETAVVLGAQVSGTQPSQALAGRLAAAVELYRTGKVQRILMSGDGSSAYYNEIAPMRAYALAAGVPAKSILEDPLGLRTYDTCSRLKSVFHIDHPILVTQLEHLKRAIYTCRSLGIDAVGYSYDADSWPRDMPFLIREQGALVLAWFDVNLLHPQPTSSK